MEADRRDSTIRLSDDAVDENGVAILADVTMPLNEDSVIAPWIDLPPTPPPKNTPHSKTFGFSQKASFVSLVSLRHNSSTSLPRHSHSNNLRSSESQASLYTVDSNSTYKRRSTDDNESSTGVVYSGSSSHSGGASTANGNGDLRRQKSSIFSRLKSRPSKPKLREDSEESEYATQHLHPSLRPPVPPLPEQRPLIGLGLGAGLGLGGSASTVALSLSSSSGGKKGKEKEKAGKGLKKKDRHGHGKVPPTPPPKDGEPGGEWREYSGDLNLNSMEGILDLSVVSAGLGTTSSPLSNGNSVREHGYGSPASSGLESSQSYSDHGGGLGYHNHAFVPASEFSNPFSTSSSNSTNGRPIKDNRKVSPTSIPPPNSQSPPSSSSFPSSSRVHATSHPVAPPLQINGSDSLGTISTANSTPTSGPGSPTWVAPESWAVAKGAEDPYNNPDATEHAHPALLNGHKTLEVESGSDEAGEGTIVVSSKRNKGKEKHGERKMTGGGTVEKEKDMLSLEHISKNAFYRRRHANGPSTTSPSSSFSSSFSSSLSLTSLTSRPSISTSTISGSSRTPRGSQGSIRPPMYKMRIYRVPSHYHMVSIELDTTVTELIVKLTQKVIKEMEADAIKHGLPFDRDLYGSMVPGKIGREQYNLYLKEQGRERMLGPHEQPAAIVKLRMEQAGYDAEEGQYLLGVEGLNMLLKLNFKSQLLAGEEKVELEDYQFISLQARGLRTIPVILHQHADQIISLKLDRNPMIEIPLDFIQSCTTLRDLHLSNMSMKKVPQSLRHSTTLHRLHLSSNLLWDLDEAYLDHIPGLMHLDLGNNRLEKLPWYFPRLRTLQILNISNNKFRVFPQVVTQLENLKELDVSFNMLHELPESIGKLTKLDRFVLIGNHITRFPDEIVGLTALRRLDCRRNQITDLGVVCMLPSLQHLSADWNAVHVVDLSLGENLRVLELAHNDITQLSLVPGPMGRPPYALTTLDLSYAKLSSLDDIALSQLSSLRTLKLDHNSIRSIPDTLGELRWLETLSCTDNKLDALPRTIGKLSMLKVLDAHNNSLTELPGELWECGCLEKVNVTSNFIGSWADPPIVSGSGSLSATMPSIPSAGFLESPTSADGHLTVPAADGMAASARKQSLGSASIKDSSASIKDSKENLPPLARSLQKLYIGENCLSGDGVLRPIMIFVELRVLNLSFNDIQDLPPAFFRNMTHLEEIYLSGNKLTSIPAEDFPRLTKLRTLYLNGNKLHTLPQELGKVASLKVFDVGSNFLKYNINNWEFDWNWNFNTNLRYLNLSGNKRLQIKADSSSHRMSRYNGYAPMISGFTSLSRLRVLGLMDVTITTTAKDATVDIPDENADRRVRTSLSTVCGMSYGIADSLGKNDYLTMVDLVHEFQENGGEAIFAMFGNTQPSKGLKPGVSPNTFSKFLHDKFVNVFKSQLEAVKKKVDKDDNPIFPKKEGIRKALHWTFLKLNQDIWEYVVLGRKDSQAGIQLPTYNDSMYYRMGASGIALYFHEKTIYAANVGDALAVVSRQGICHEISRKHDPSDRLEMARIRAAEGWISETGLVNEEVDVSRSFGYFHLLPPINARPDIFIYDLTEMDEFVIIANRGLWDYVPYQTAVDIARTVARTERPDPMLAAEKLRDFAISYGADGSTMIMVIWVADLFSSPAARSRQPTLDSIIDPQMYKVNKKKGEIRDHDLDRLNWEVPPPTGHVTIVFTDIRNSTHLWEANPGMATAMRLHNGLLRRQLRFCGGYEVKTEGDSFMCSFPTTLAAVWWCLTVQVQLLHESWPLEILECEDGKPIYDTEGRLIARGLSVRMGIHSGNPLCETDLITSRMDYFGPMVNRSARINGSAQGGQIMCSMDIIKEIRARVLETGEETDYSHLQNPAAIENIKRIGVVIKDVGEVKLKGIELPEILSVLYPNGLEGRHDLKEAPADPSSSSGSPFKLNVSQVKELGVLTLRTEALSSARVFKPLPNRKASIQSNPETPALAIASKTFYGDPNLLLPSINDNTSEADLLLVLDSLATRLENALDAIGNRFQVPLSPAVDFLMKTLTRDGALDRETLDYITSILRR